MSDEVTSGEMGVPGPTPEPPSTLESLRIQAAALREQLRALEEAERAETARIAEENRLKELEKPITLKVVNVSPSSVTTDSDYREDLVEVFRKTPGRYYKGQRENMIPLAEWEKFVERASQLKNITIDVPDDLLSQIDKIIHAPKFLVDIDKTFLTITPGPYENDYFLGRKFQGVKKSGPVWLVPLSEAWRIPSAFDIMDNKWVPNDPEKQYAGGHYEYIKVGEVQGVVYTDAAHEFITHQIEARATLDLIAKETSAPEISEALRAEGFNGTLRGFQEVGVKFIEAAGGRALICDQVGLGKTWEALGFAQLKHLSRVLVVCPAALKLNWLRQIKERLCEEARVLSGGDPTIFAAEMMIQPKRFTIMNYDILAKRIELCPNCDEKLKAGKCPMCLRDTDHGLKPKVRWPWIEFLSLPNMRFDLVIFDEAHYTKNTKSHRSQAARHFVEQVNPPFVLPMTGSPVTNRPKELWPLLKLVAPIEFEAEERFLERYVSADGNSARNVEELHELIKRIFIRRKKKDVQQSLPPINKIVDYHELSPKATRLYCRVLEGVYESIAAYNPYGVGGQEMSVMSILAQLVRLKQVCAIDKADQTAELVTDIVDSLENENGHSKVLVYSQFKGSAYAIYQRLQELGALCFVEKRKNAKGRWEFHTASYDERDAIIQKFQNDPSIKVLVATSQALREGLDVTAAGVVVWNDLLWTPAAHEQGEGRAYGRLGDEHGIDARYIVTGDITNLNSGEDEPSIEQMIQNILARKDAMIKQTVEGVDDARITDQSVVQEIIEGMKQRRWRK